MRPAIDLARERAQAAPGTFVGVVLQKPAPAMPTMLPFWSTFSFRTLAEMDDWWRDWVGQPTQYVFLAMFDKSITTSDPIAFAPGPDGTAATRMGSLQEGHTMSKFEQLSHLIALHETFWAAVAQNHPQSTLMRQWLQSEWDPFFRRWLDITGDGEPLSEALTGKVAQGLSQVRQLARQKGIPVPDIGTRVPPAEDSPLVSSINVETDRRFAAATGHTGKLDPRNPADAQLIPTWLSLRYQVAQEVAQDARRGQGGVQVSGGGHHGGGGHHHGGGYGRRGRGRGFGGWGGGWDPYFYGYGYEEPVVIYDGSDGDGDDGTAVISGYRGLRAHVVPRHERLLAVAPAFLPDHEATYVGGWLDSISNAVHGAINSVTGAVSSAVGTVGHTLAQLKGPIAAAAGMAAGAAALAIPAVGPLVAPMASSLAGTIVNAATGSGDVKIDAKAVVAQVTAAAQQNPQIAAALDTAHRAVAKATAGYHVVQTVANAAAGNQDALAQVDELAMSAAAGDPAAQQALDLAHRVTANVTDNASASSADAAAAAVSGAIATSPRAQAIAAAKEAPSRVTGIVQHSDGSWQLVPFESPDDADDWFGQWCSLPDAFRYVAYFDRADPSWPGPLNEQAGKHVAAHVGGWFLPFALGVPTGIAAAHFGPPAYRWTRGKWDAYRMQKLADQEVARLHGMTPHTP